MATGTIKSFNATKGFGYITLDGGGEDIFCHHSSFDPMSGLTTLQEGQKVQFELSRGPKGLEVKKVRLA